MPDKRSLHTHYGFRADVYLLWLASTAALTAGLSMPVITFTELIFKKTTFSIFSGIMELWNHNEQVLGFVIFAFSVIFPMVKLISLAGLWFFPFDTSGRRRVVGLLGHLGKWSMLDVYVVAMTIVIAKSSALVKAKPEAGIYLFGASVMLSIFASSRIERLSKKVS